MCDQSILIQILLSLHAWLIGECSLCCSVCRVVLSRALRFSTILIYDTTTNLSTTTNYFKLDMHEHQQQPTTSHSQDYQPSFVPLIRKYESFSTTVEPPRGLCATSDLHCNDCGRPKTSFYEPPAIFINILPQNDLDVCKILSLPFTGSAADHVQELYISSDLHCNDCNRPHMSYHKSPAILITILPQKYLERYKILSSPFTDPAADPLDKLCSVSDLQPDDRGRLLTKYCAVCCCCLRSTVCEFRLFI